MDGEGARERRRRETHARIEQAALELFARDGFEATSIDAIAQRAEVGPRTVLRYFAVKRDLVFAASATDLATLRRLLAEQPAGAAAPDALVAALEALAEHLDVELTSDRARAVQDDEALTPWAAAIRDEWAVALGSDLAERGDGLGERDAVVLAQSALFAQQQAVLEWASMPAASRAPLREVAGERLRTWRGLYAGGT